MDSARSRGVYSCVSALENLYLIGYMHFMSIELYHWLMQTKIVTWMSSGLLSHFTCVFRSNLAFVAAGPRTRKYMCGVVLNNRNLSATGKFNDPVPAVGFNTFGTWILKYFGIRR